MSLINKISNIFKPHNSVFLNKTARDKGFAGEDKACEFLKNKGYIIIERNYTSSHGEIDIIASDGRHIIFVEVKTREEGKNTERYGRPALAVTREKQRKIIYTAKSYCGYDKGLIPRFDVIEVYKNSGDDVVEYRINHIERAFDLNTAGIKRY